jgi:hypothetical protein
MQYGIYSYVLSMALPRWKGQSPETWDSVILFISVGNFVARTTSILSFIGYLDYDPESLGS